ncbi:MAG: nuclear transport factor 2 family protein [Acidimicrobiales bacterium]
MSLERDRATAFVQCHGQTWENWDLAGFVDLFSDDVVYVEHPTDETVVGREEMARYIRKEQDEQGLASVRMGKPMVDGDLVAAEFWATMTSGEEEGTLAGCFMARLDPTSGRCTHFRQYWFELDGHVGPFNGWGERAMAATARTSSLLAAGRQGSVRGTLHR